MLFAAGFGTRMGDLTADRPKPMISVAGRPLIDHALDLIKTYGPLKTVVNTHYKPQALMEHLKEEPVHLIHEEGEILETGGGLRNALPVLGTDPVFTMNTDAVWAGPNPLQTLSMAWDPDKMDACLLCLPTHLALGHKGNGDFVAEANMPAQRGPGLVYSGLQIVKTDRLRDIKRDVFSLNALWDLLMADQRLFITPYDGQWCDVGYPEAIPLAERMLEASGV